VKIFVLSGSNNFWTTLPLFKFALPLNIWPNKFCLQEKILRNNFISVNNLDDDDQTEQCKHHVKFYASSVLANEAFKGFDSLIFFITSFWDCWVILTLQGENKWSEGGSRGMLVSHVILCPRCSSIIYLQSLWFFMKLFWYRCVQSSGDACSQSRNRSLSSSAGWNSRCIEVWINLLIFI